MVGDVSVKAVGFPKIRDSWGSPNKDYSVLGLYWGSPILGEYDVLQDEGPVQKCVSK